MSSEPLPAIEFHPDAPRPNMLWSASLPLTWRFVDTHPSRWQLKADRLVEDYIPGVRLKAAEKRLVKQQLESTVQAAQKAGVLMTFVLPGLLEDGQVSSATLLISWRDSAPNAASLQPAKIAFPDLKSLKTENGASYGLLKLKKQVGPLTQRQTSYTTQGFLPIPQTTWTLIVSGSAPGEELGGVVEDLVIRLINSVTVLPGTEGLSINDVLGRHDGEENLIVDNSGGWRGADGIKE